MGNPGVCGAVLLMNMVNAHAQFVRYCCTCHIFSSRLCYVCVCCVVLCLFICLFFLFVACSDEQRPSEGSYSPTKCKAEVMQYVNYVPAFPHNND